MNIQSNEARCTSCHAGYGWKDKEFDFTAQEKVDCLVCHDTTGTYKKFPTMAGYPVTEQMEAEGQTFFPPNYNEVAQSVGRPMRQNCGACHFYGGGGDGVKHGDLDSSLVTPSKELDVHMNAEGANMSCVRCHTTTAHKIAGRCYKKPAFEERKSLIDDDQISRISCESCHTAAPHEPGHKANDHTDKVSCQACHIPAYARVLPTKMEWDWSTAGELKNGKPFTRHGEFGKHTYDSKKGGFRWEKNVEPEYRWFNGALEYTLIPDTIDPSRPVQLNRPAGDKDDPKSRIYPFKVHRGKQPYDRLNNTMVAIHLFGKDPAAYWKTFDWNASIAAGMDYIGLEYSGEYGFVDTEYYFQTTHMVAPKEKALACDACHAKQGRLANLGGFYMPGRDANSVVDTLGWIAVLGSILMVFGHGVLRIVIRKRRDAAGGEK